MNKRQAKRAFKGAPPVGKCPPAPTRRVIRAMVSLRRQYAEQIRDLRRKYLECSDHVSSLSNQIGNANRVVAADVLFRAEAAEMRAAHLAKKLAELGVSPDQD